MITDVSATDILTETYSDYTITEFEIVKRQTDAEDKTDTVYSTLTVINDDESVQGHIDLKIVYGLYDEGWILDECSIDEEGENDGVYFVPLKGLELSVEEISSIISETGYYWSDIDVYSNEVSLEDGLETYAITGTETHKYMTSNVDAILTCSFLSSEGKWGTPDLTISSSNDVWHIAGEYYRSGDDEDTICILNDEPSDYISIRYIIDSARSPVYDRDASLTCEELYETQTITMKSLISNTLSKWGTGWGGRSSIYRYLGTYDGFDVILPSGYNSLNSFEYVTLWNAANRGVSDGILFIGKDAIAVTLDYSHEISYDTRNIILNVYELIPKET